ncbi:hypothetical protein GW17_00050357 [Ensete ventricosum]|nr:hypothetical protein GW17_00050357 [Ensete ventricosum]
MDLNVLRKNPWMPGGKGAPTVDPESAQPEVEVMHLEASRKRPAGSSAPDPTATGRPRKRVKIAVRRHKAHRDEGSSRRVNRERESEVSMGDTSPTYCRPKSMRDLCGMRVQEDDKGYYVLQMADWAPRDSSAAMQARWSNLLYQSRVWDDSEAASEFDRGVLHLTLAKDLYTLPSEVLIARAAKQIVLADNAKLKSGLDELSSRLDKADKEPNKLREGLVESQRQLKEQKANHRKANDELLKLMRENESLKADLPGKSITDYKRSGLWFEASLAKASVRVFSVRGTLEMEKCWKILISPRALAMYFAMLDSTIIGPISSRAHSRSGSGSAERGDTVLERESDRGEPGLLSSAALRLA